MAREQGPDQLRASKNFLWSELECKCGCGTRNIDKEAIRKLQMLRIQIGKPFTINSAARCPKHNWNAGGKMTSRHLSVNSGTFLGVNIIKATAFDISIVGHDAYKLKIAAQQCGFNGIGIARSFIHIDIRGKKAEWFY